MKKRILIDSADALCKPNAIGVSKLAAYARENGCELVTDVAAADVIIVNTCGFDEKYERNSCDLFARHFAQKRPGAAVVSVGCLNIINRPLLESRFPELRIVNDHAELDAIIEAVVPYDPSKDAYFDVSVFDVVKLQYPQPRFVSACIKGARALERLTRLSRSGRIDSLHLPQILEEADRDSTKSLFVLIGRGCANNCSYCVIKKAQGDPKSRPVDAILADIRKIHAPGKTLSLVADDCASWGLERGDSFVGLVDRINAEFPGIPIDVTYINPTFLSRREREYVELCGRANINSMNVSLQSGSDRIVRLMNRKYRVADVLRTIDDIRRASPRTMIWAHAMVGFPTETWREYRMTLQALDHMDFFYAFPFSARPGTKAAQLDGRIPSAVCELRAKAAYARYAARIGLKAAARSLM